MNVNAMSDIHLEFGGQFEVGESDVLVLAGDVGMANHPDTYVPFLEETSEKVGQIIMIMGNHEHYKGDINKSQFRIQRATSHLDNFILLEDNSMVIGDVAFIGATFWSDISPAYELLIQQGMNDYYLIDDGKYPLRVNKTNEKHYVSRKKIFDAIDIYRRSGFKTVVITHHNPTLRTAEIYRGNILNSAYGTDLEHLVEMHEPDFWIYGHTHVSGRYTVGKTDVICNPRGYYPDQLNEDFDVNLTIEV